MLDSSSSGAQPPSWRQLRDFHVREWTLKDDRLAPIVHNLMPLVGLTLLGWSASLTLFSLWLDGLTAFGMSVALLVHRLSLDPPTIELSRRDFVVAWIVLMALLGLPYYIGLVARWDLVSEALEDAFRSSWLTALVFGVMVFASAFSIRRRWRAEREVVPRSGALAREMHVHLVRAMAVAALLLLGAAPVFAVAVLALLYAYLETFPNTMLMLFVGNPAPGSPYDAWKKRYEPEALFEHEQRR